LSPSQFAVLGSLRSSYRFRDDFLDVRFRGTFAPFLRASLSPIAIACLRLFTVPPFPPRPLLSVPRFRLRIALSTLFPAALPYRRRPDFLPDFRVAMEPSV
jgi:hypothetical protein